MFQEPLVEAETVVLTQSQSGAFMLGDFWNLVQQAGPLRWPIFLVLGMGLVLVFSKLYELVRDGAVSRTLFQTSLESADLERIVGEISGQKESMLATLQSTMLNVFQTRPGEGMLHDEIHNFVSFQQDQFGVFRRRMEFLSDTAGALGLMGTVWGMFTVFFQGTSDQDVILRGMGIALITTLLGLVVSIVLNFSSTELSTFFEKRLERVSKKSDELRFRLMELAPAAPPFASVAVPAAPPPAMKGPPGARGANPAPTKPGGGKSPDPQPRSEDWFELSTDQRTRVATAGETVRDLGLVVTTRDGLPAKGVTVSIALSPGAGSLGDGGTEARVDSDAEGRVAVGWTAPEKVGSHSLEAVVHGGRSSTTRVALSVKAAEPASAVAEGNNQAAPAGTRLRDPLGVRVRDRFGNPVANVQVSFAVKMGDGGLGRGEKKVEVPSTDTGLAAVPFALGREPGPNSIEAQVPGVPDKLLFTAFGTEA